MDKVVLNNGVEMPILGFGVYQITDSATCETSVLAAMETGYRLIDTAAAYQNEEAVGRAIRASAIPRGDLFITTKLWIQANGHEGTRKAFEKSLRNLQLDYLDLYLIHQPFGDIYGEWRVMEELFREGRIRAIGISNFSPDRVMDFILHHQIIPAVNQLETHPFHQQFETQAFLSENRIQLQSWGPFAEGRNNLFFNPVLREIGENHNKSIAQVVLRWLIQRNIAVIPKSVRKEKISENFQVFDFTLSETEMEAIKSLDKKESQFFDHRDPAMVKRLASYKIPY